MARRKRTPNQEIFQQQRRRLQQSKYYAQKKGFIFDTDPVPKMPKRVTKQAIERIKAMTTEDLYPLATSGVDLETGKVIDNPVDARKLQKEQQRKRRSDAQKRRYRKQKEKEYKQPNIPYEHEPLVNLSQQVVDNAISDINHLPTKMATKLISFIKNLVNEKGVDAVAQSMMDMPGDFHYYLEIAKYSSDEAVVLYASDLVNYLPELEEQDKIDLLDDFDFYDSGYTIE